MKSTLLIFCCNISSLLSWIKMEMTLGELVTVIIAVVGLIIAICQYRAGKKQTWFLNVIVLPQLDPIKDFYLELIGNVKNDKDKIKTLGEQTTHNQYKVEIAKIKNQRKGEINNFFDHLSTLVSAYDANLAKQVTNETLDLQDTYVNIIDDICNGTEAKERERILKSKNILISILTKEIAR